MAERDLELDEWIARVSADVLQPAALERYTRRVNDSIMARLPDLAGDAELRRDLDASTTAQLRTFMTTATTSSVEYRPPPEAVALARTVARRGMDVQVLLKIYGTGRTTALTLLNEVVQSIPVSAEMKLAAMVELWGLLMGWLEQSTDVLLSAYTEEREALMRGALARRTNIVHSVLRGEKIAVDNASAALDYPLRHHHTGAVLWSEHDDPDVLSALEGAAHIIGKALGAGRPLTIASGAHGLWAWFASVRPPHLESVLSVSGAPAWPGGVSASVGTPAPGTEGFVTTHREALAAYRVAVAGTAPPRLTRYDDIQIAYLMGMDQEALRRFVHRELGPLAGADDSTARLRETLRAYFRSGSSPAQAAKVLRVHKNTVRYRVERAQEILGPSFTERRLELEIALACVSAYPSLKIYDV